MQEPTNSIDLIVIQTLDCEFSFYIHVSVIKFYVQEMHWLLNLFLVYYQKINIFMLQKVSHKNGTKKNVLVNHN